MHNYDVNNMSLVLGKQYLNVTVVGDDAIETTLRNVTQEQGGAICCLDGSGKMRARTDLCIGCEYLVLGQLFGCKCNRLMLVLLLLLIWLNVGFT